MTEKTQLLNFHPFFMYGTAWKEDRTQKCVEQALRAGFRAIDTANQRKHYHEAGVGEALELVYQEGSLQRKDIFLQTKYTYQRGQDHRLPYDPSASFTDQVQQSFASSLEHLKTDYLDSYVLHGPASGKDIIDSDWEVWRAMETLQKSGQAKVLGVSNISARQLEQLLDDCDVTPSFVQNRCYANKGWDKDVRELCNQHDCVYQGFSLLTANRQIPNHPEFRGLAQALGKTAPQVIFRFARQLGMLPLTGTTNPEHMALDLDIEDFELSAADMDFIETIETNG
ncbi:MAG: aldo/keto reductase [Planctomycetota bacterium]|nr:aldo/keto reductase [Planctomycetota bacterium]